MNKVILTFSTAKQLEKWEKILGTSVTRVSKNFSMIAATLTAKQQKELLKEKGIAIYPDHKLVLVR